MTRPYVSQRVRYVPPSAVLGHDVLEAVVVSIDALSGTVGLRVEVPVVGGVRQSTEPTFGFWYAIEDIEEKEAA